MSVNLEPACDHCGGAYQANAAAEAADRVQLPTAIRGEEDLNFCSLECAVAFLTKLSAKPLPNSH